MPYSPELIRNLKKKANLLRKDVIEMTWRAGSGHPGGSLSAAEIVATLYFHFLRIDPQNPKWEDRDRFILSKGHACPVVYAALGEAGFFPREGLWTLRKFGSILQGHPDMKSTPGLDFTAGSLGQGLSAGLGMALGGKLDKKDFRVIVLLGDGEIQEGQIWEAAMAAAHYKLDNLIAIVDYNRLQIDGRVEEVVNIEPLVAKWQAFGWNVLEIDGHNPEEILNALETATKTKGRPTVIIAHTLKGKGVSFMLEKVEWHGMAPTKEQAEQALRELEEEEKRLEAEEVGA